METKRYSISCAYALVISACVRICSYLIGCVEEDGRKLTVFFLDCLEYYYNWIDKKDEPMNSELEQANGNCSPFAVILTGEHYIVIVAFLCFGHRFLSFVY